MAEMKAKEKEALHYMKDKAKEGKDQRNSVTRKAKSKKAHIPPKIGEESAMAGNGPSG